jgi:signal transduction histidine kinase
LKNFKPWLKSQIWVKKPPLALSSDYLAGNAAVDAEAFQTGLDLATQGIVLLDESGRIVSVNSCAPGLIHSALASLPGVDFWDAVPENIAEAHRSAAEQALQTTGSHTFVGHYAFEDQWVEYGLRRHSCGLVVNLKDVTETHRALLLLQDSAFCNQSLFDANPQAMWLFDADSRRILAANKAAAAFYGSAQQPLTALPVEALFPDGEGAAWLSSLPVTDFQQELRLCTQKKMDGERVLVELACASMQWLERPAVLVGVVDVGARHLADANLRRLNAGLEQRVEQCSGELRRSHHELEAFTYALSNDLKAPLHVVDGFARTLAERYSAALDEQGRHYLARIQASTRQLAKLIDDLRTLTYLPRMPMVIETVDLAPVCRRLMDDLRKREPGRQVMLETEPTLPLVGDKALLVTALACLIDNAWKFTSKKEQGWIKVGLMPGKTPNDRVLFVSDNGAGFDAAHADKLFKAFQRLHSSADFPGSGLGLAIVERVAELHGGEVWGVTAANAGASFFLSLPQGQGEMTLSPPA